MDISKFGSKSPGKLLPIAENQQAFLPDPLPPAWEFPPSLWPALAEAKAKMGLLEGVGRTLPNPGLLLRPLAQREAIQSSRLEGTYASPKELLLYELEPHEERPGEGRASDWREVFNYRKALDHAIASELPLSLRLLRDMHRILLTGVRGKERAPGEFRRVQVAIGVNSRFIPPPPEQIPACLNPLEKYLHQTTAYDPLVDCFLTHYQFETIHPFMDGNGRVGRLLLAIMIQKRCALTKPWLYLSEFFEKNRDEYCQRLFQISAEGAWEGWVGFCLRGAIEQADGTVKRCDKIRSIRETYMQRLAEVGGSVRLNQIVENLFRSPYVRVTDVARELGVTYPTAKADLDRLVKARILRELHKVSQKTFYAHEVYDAAYRDIE